MRVPLDALRHSEFDLDGLAALRVCIADHLLRVVVQRVAAEPAAGCGGRVLVCLCTVDMTVVVDVR